MGKNLKLSWNLTLKIRFYNGEVSYSWKRKIKTDCKKKKTNCSLPTLNNFNQRPKNKIVEGGRCIVGWKLVFLAESAQRPPRLYFCKLHCCNSFLKFPHCVLFENKSTSVEWVFVLSEFVTSFKDFHKGVFLWLVSIPSYMTHCC